MARLNEGHVEAILDSLITRDDRVVVVHSALWNFMHRLAWPSRQAAANMFDCLVRVVGPERTLLLPTFSLEYCGKRVFDLKRTPSEVGILSQEALDHPSMRRTPRPIYSFAARGPHTPEITSIVGESSWGPGSIMEWLQTQDARFIVLGCPWHLSCSYIHRAEEIERVPYRYHKTFDGTFYVDGEEIGPISETMYVRAASTRPVFDYAPASEAIAKSASFLASDEPSIPAESCRASDIMAVSLDLLRKDPYEFVVNRDAVRQWVENDRERELASMTPRERGEVP